MLFVGRQAGTAYALSPVIDRLKTQGRSLQVLGTAQARDVWREAGLLDASVGSFAEAAPMLGLSGVPEVVVTGTSVQVEDDAQYWRWARHRDIPCVAYVESWVNYAERFDGFRELPDVVAVVDGRAAAGLRALGCPGDRIREVGNPAFDALEPIVLAATTEPGSLLWVGEPLSTVSWPGGSALEHLGYDECVVMEALGRCLVEMSSDERPHELWIATHPRERPERYEDWMERLRRLPNMKVQLITGRGREWAARAGVVVGMTSMLLVESAHMGVATISVQPNKRTRSDVVDDRSGITVVDTEEGLIGAIREASRRPARAHVIACRHTERFLALLDELGRPIGARR